MKRSFLTIFLISGLFLSACEGSVSEESNSADGNSYVDAKYGVSFEYPAHWVSRRDMSTFYFGANFDYMDGLAETSTSTELEGTLTYSVTQNPENLSMKAFYDASYEECRSEPVAEDADFGPLCYQPHFESGWEVFEIDGYTTYQSDWDGVAESGSIAKDLYVDLGEKGAFIHLSAIKTGMTDEEAIQKTVDDAFASLSIE